MGCQHLKHLWFSDTRWRSRALCVTKTDMASHVSQEPRHLCAVGKRELGRNCLSVTVLNEGGKLHVGGFGNDRRLDEGKCITHRSLAARNASTGGWYS